MRAYMMALGLLFLALGQPSFAQEGETSGQGPPPPLAEKELVFVVRGKFPTLNCSDSASVSSTDVNFTWKVNDTELEKAPILKDRYELKEHDSVFELKVKPVEDDFGNYTCIADGQIAFTYRVRGKTVAYLDDDHSVVEGQKIKIKCRLVGKPYPEIRWTYRAIGADNATEAAEALGADRVSYADNDAGVPGAALVLTLARLTDEGNFSCSPFDPLAVPAYSRLRVKDMYAALWPFLGICIEVFILCAVILVYEKRRTKPEQEDSDTDNHEQ